MGLQKYRSFLLILFLLSTSCSVAARGDVDVKVVERPMPIAEPAVALPRAGTDQNLESSKVKVIRVTNTASPVGAPEASIEEVTLTPAEESSPAPSATETASAEGVDACEPWEPFELKPGQLAAVGMTWDPPCVHWVDEFDDESGFRIEFAYGIPAVQGADKESFVWEVPADTQHLLVPEEAGPPFVSWSGCKQSRGFDLVVYAIRPAGNTLVDGTGASAGSGGCP